MSYMTWKEIKAARRSLRAIKWAKRYEAVRNRSVVVLVVGVVVAIVRIGS